MKHKLFLLSTLVLVLFSGFGCLKPRPSLDFDLVLVSFLSSLRPEIKVSGYVKSVYTNKGVSAAKIALGDSTTTTDERGFYSLTVSEEYKSEILKISAGNFIPFQSSPRASSGKEIMLETFLKPVDKTEIVDPAVENVIISLDGAEVKLPVLSGITEKLVVSVTNFHVATDDIRTISGDFSAIDASGAETNIYSSGMIDVQIKGADTGNNYSLEGKGTYTIKIPVTGNKDSTPDTIPLWYFDTDKNKWVEQGQATLDPTRTFYEGTVTHFSTWNADQKMAVTTAVSGTIVDPSPAIGEVYRISVMFDGFYRTFSQTASDLDFTIVNLPQNKEMFLEVKKMSTGEAWLKTIPPVTDATYNAGIFPDADYVGNVVNVAVINGEYQVTLNWEDPSYDNFEKVKITFSSSNTAETTVEALKGEESYIFPGLNSEEYTFTITALYGDGKESVGLVKKTYVYSLPSATLTLFVNGSGYGSYVLVNGVNYTAPIDYPIRNNVPITVELNAVKVSWDYFDFWLGDGINDSNKSTNPLEIIMDSDKTIEARFGITPN